MVRWMVGVDVDVVPMVGFVLVRLLMCAAAAVVAVVEVAAVAVVVMTVVADPVVGLVV